MQMEFYTIGDTFKTTPVLNEQQALKKATDFTGANIYKWSGYTGNDPEYMPPHGKLVIIKPYKKEGEVCLAYKFDIEAVQPLSRAYVYINAWDGTVILNDPIIKHLSKYASQPPLPPPTGDKKLTGKISC